MHARHERRGDWRPGHHHARGDPAGQGFGAGENIGDDSVVLVGKPLAGAPHAGLNLVEHQEHAVLVADPPQAGEIIGRRDVDSPLPLHRLDQDRRRFVVDGRGRGGEVVVGHVDETRHHRLEAGMVLGLGGGREGGEGPAVKAPLHRHDLDTALPSGHGPAPA